MITEKRTAEVEKLFEEFSGAHHVRFSTPAPVSDLDPQQR